jgi:hypothetical protein
MGGAGPTRVMGTSGLITAADAHVLRLYCEA